MALVFRRVLEVNRVQVVLSGFGVRLLCFVPGKNFIIGIVVCISWL